MTGRPEAEIAAKAAMLSQRFGPMSWNALLYKTSEEQAQAEATIKAYNRKHHLD